MEHSEWCATVAPHDCVDSFNDLKQYRKWPHFLVSHCTFPILEWSHKTVVTTTSHHQEISGWQLAQSMHSESLAAAIFNNYVLPILIPSCSVSWMYNSYPLPARNPVPYTHIAVEFCPRWQSTPLWNKCCPLKRSFHKNLCDYIGPWRKKQWQHHVIVT